MLGAASPLSSSSGVTVVTALILDGPFVQDIAHQVGLPVAILPVEAASDAEGPRSGLRERALETGTSASGELADV